MVANDYLAAEPVKPVAEILLIGWLLSLILVGVAGWQFSNDAIKPVSDIIDQVNNISANNLHEKCAGG